MAGGAGYVTFPHTDRLATEDEPEVPALQGWRREVFGHDALALKQGRVALGVDGRRIKLIRLET